MEKITPDQLMTTVIVLLAVFAAIVTVDKVIDVFKKWNAPAADTAKMLANDKRRLEEHDAAISALQDSNRVLCGGILALLDHELHNGNATQMEKARDDIMGYLQGRIVK